MTKKLWLSCMSIFLSTGAFAQNAVEGTTYYLPKTALNYTLLIERVTAQPGELSMYAGRFLKKDDVISKPTTAYRILKIQMTSVGVADTAKRFTPKIDAKHSINSMKVDENSGILLAVNAEAKRMEKPAPFIAAPKPLPLNPRDYMSQEILAAGSSAKMAELIAQEIYDIRESKSQLNKGQADFMPKDKHYERMEHCIGIEQDKVKDGLYKAFRNGSCYNECIPEWEDLVRNGYAKRWGEIGQTIFYGVTRKGFEAIARRWGVRIRYEIEVG